MAGAAAAGPSTGASPQEEAFDGLLGGGAQTRRPGCLTPDGTRLALCCGHLVKLYSTATGLPHLELRGHRGEVTAVAVRPQPPPDSSSARPPSGQEGAASVQEVVTTSLDGTVRVWTLVGGAAGGGGAQQRCRVVQAPGKVESVALPPAPSPLAFLSIRKEASDDAGAGRVVCINLISGKVLGDSLAKTAAPCMLVCSAAGGVLATWEKHTATLWSVANVTRAAGTSAASAAAGRIPQPLRLRHTKALTCVSVDPGERRLAAGDVTGRVLIWHGIHTAVAAMAHDGAAAGAAGAGGGGAHVQVTTLHWHAGPVACISWSPDGTRLLSGGGESVLVLWRPEEGTKTFLPRLGGPLSWLAHCDVDAAQLALGCGDNAAHVVNLATMRVTTTVRGAAPALLMAPQQQQAAVVFEQPCGPVWDARTGCVVLPAAGGALQWYDMATDAGAGYVHITEAGRQPSLAPPPPTDSSAAPGSSKAALHRRPVEPHVCGASLGPGGGVLVSVDRIGEGSSGDDLTRVTDTLRFWRLADGGDGAAGATSPVYVLTTRVDAPHGGATVTAVHHAPVPGWAVTTSAGGCDFRLWTCGATPATSATWRCRSVGFYQKRPMTCAAFSPDASLLAVGARDAVTVWEPRSNALVAVLYPVPPAPAVAPCSVEFLAFLSPQQQEAADRPGATSPMLCAVWDFEHQQGAAAMPSGGGMCVYDLLSLQAVRRHAPLGGRVLSCATDAGATSVAVLMQPAPRPQAQAQSPAPPLVLLFSGPSSALTAAWALRSDASSVAGTRLVFVPRAAVARHSALGGGSNPSASALDGSCLVLVTSDRRFILAPLPQDDTLLAQAGAGGEPAALAWGSARTPDAAAKAPRDGLGDAFGSLRVTPGDARPLFTGASSAGGAGAEWVSPLAGVPSHSLPPLTAILPLYLDALLKASEPASST